MRKVIILACVFMVLFLSCESVPNRTELDFTREIYKLDDISISGPSTPFDIKDINDVNAITIFLNYRSFQDLESMKNVFFIEERGDINSILESFKRFRKNDKYENIFDTTTYHTRIIVELNNGDFFDIEVKDDFIVIMKNRQLVNSRTYLYQGDYEEFIQDLLGIN